MARRAVANIATNVIARAKPLSPNCSDLFPTFRPHHHLLPSTAFRSATSFEDVPTFSSGENIVSRPVHGARSLSTAAVSGGSVLAMAEASDATGGSSSSTASSTAPTSGSESNHSQPTGTAAAASSEGTEKPKAPERVKLLVLGGNGFVGSAVCKEALSRGLPTISLNRSGAPAGLKEDWVAHVEWMKGSILEPEKWKGQLSEVTAVISCVGAFGSDEFMRKINGEANALAASTAAAEGVKRFVYVSAHDVGLPSFVLRGYYEGKWEAEASVKLNFPYGGIILRPAMIHGNRRVGNFTIPIGLIGQPLETVLRRAKWAGQLPVIGPALAPPVSVNVVARAAVRAAVDNAVPPGVLDVWGIIRMGER